jgi:hypothetical protein
LANAVITAAQHSVMGCGLNYSRRISTVAALLCHGWIGCVRLNAPLVGLGKLHSLQRDGSLRSLALSLQRSASSAAQRSAASRRARAYSRSTAQNGCGPRGSAAWQWEQRSIAANSHTVESADSADRKFPICF